MRPTRVPAFATMAIPRTRLSRKRLRRQAATSIWALMLVAALTIIAILLAGIAVKFTDPNHFDSVWEGWWWASTTVTTVGYGDIVPSSVLGRFVAVALMFTGIGLVSILTAALASALLAEDVGDEEQHIDVELANLTTVLQQVEARLAVMEQLLEGQPPQAPGSPPR
jgi:voltage-gated potassium channel